MKISIVGPLREVLVDTDFQGDYRLSYDKGVRYLDDHRKSREVNVDIARILAGAFDLSPLTVEFLREKL